MGLKQQVEAAALKVIDDAGLYTGDGLKSQEDQETVKGLTNVLAIATVLAPERVTKKGEFAGPQRVRLDVIVLTDADKQGSEEPETAHNEHVEEIRDSLRLATLAALLTAASDEITVVAALSSQAALPAQERKFCDGLAWELICYESKVG